MRVTIDFETRSPVDIRKCGPWVYAEHEATEPICLALTTELGGITLWANPSIYPADPIEIYKNDPADILHAIRTADGIEAHNAEFERAIWECIMVPRFGWPEIPYYKWRCSAAKAASYALPRHLAGACEALKLQVQKDQEGYKLMMKLCRPRKARKGENPDMLHWYGGPGDFRRLFEYCLRDVEAERGLSAALDDLDPRELKIWQLDQTMNKRGVLVDIAAAQSIIRAVQLYEEKLQEELQDITFRTIDSARQVSAMAQYCDVDNLQSATVAESLQQDLDPQVRRLLEIRQALGLSSVSKFRAIMDRACHDNRVRSNLMYHGASTGRWSGKGIQPQNFPRHTIAPEDVPYALELFDACDLVWIDNCFGEATQTAKGLLRPIIMAEPGHDLICADFAGIEARVLLWLAGETEGLELFRSGADIYCEMAGTIYDRAVTKKDKTERQVGKTAILGLGYGMGAPKFRLTCKTNAGVDIDKKMSRHVVKAYRKKFPGVPSYWYGTEAAAIECTLTGENVEFGRCIWSRNKTFLWCYLPSGRRLTYPYPEVVSEPAWIYPCVDEDGNDTTIMIVGNQNLDSRLKKRLSDEDLTLAGSPLQKTKDVLKFMGVVQGKWVREVTYGGKLTENIDQAISRDLMADALVRLEEAGYRMILSVHDEAIGEVAKDFGSLGEFESIMSEVPPWAEGMPIAVEGWRGERYRK